MKTQYKFLLAAIACFGLFSMSMFSTQYFQPTKGEVANVTFAKDLKVELQERPMMVFPLEQPSKDELYRYRSLVAKQLPMAKKDPSIHFTVDEKRGLVVFNKGMMKYHGAFKPNLPSPREAEGLSMEFLKASDMMPKEEDQLKLIHNGGLRAAYVVNQKQSVTVDKLRTLTYGRQIDGIPVTGEGSKIVVNIGDKGDVVSVIHKWKNIAGKRELSKGDIKPISKAKEEIQSLIAKEFKGKAQITNVKQVYYNGNGRFIQPVYSFEAMIYEGKSKLPYYGVISAMNKPVESVSVHRQLSKQAQENIKQGSTKQLPRQTEKED